LLAIHPDYLTRNAILKSMRDQGIELTDEGKCSVALGLLRDPQLEMALEYLAQMCREGTEIPDWVFSVYFYVLGKQGFLDEALQLLQQRIGGSDGSAVSVHLSTWYFFLEECSNALHHPGTVFIWERMVQTGMINPSDGIALNVLYTASRHGNSTLATEVIQLLSARRVRLGFHHYEALLDCYMHEGDIENAFEVLHIMTEAGVQPDQSSTRSIFLALKDSPELSAKALETLSKLRKQHEIPISAVNVLLEALAQRGDMPKALDIYRQLSQLCSSGPNQQTFVVLLRSAQDEVSRDFLISEMERFSIRIPSGLLNRQSAALAR
jgi:pentatricopeptide repeat protein